MQHRSLVALAVSASVILTVLAPAAPAAASYQSGYDSCYYSQKKFLKDGTRWTMPNSGNVAAEFFNGCLAGVVQANREHASQSQPTTPSNPNPPTTPPAAPADRFWLILRPNKTTAELRRGTGHVGRGLAGGADTRTRAAGLSVCKGPGTDV